MLTELHAAGAALVVPLLDLPAGTRVRVRIPAREVILARKRPEAISVQNIIAGTIHRIAHDPDRHSSQVEIALPAGALLSRVTPDAIVRLALAPGQTVLALVKSTAIEVLTA
ncbi:MAG: TOBE domain-containing protein, partial [Acetobacteraceae bacterium]|nr:TOBE domain-containing protein [Acetobacteraceae bacterium]